MFGGQFSHTRFSLASSDDLEIIVTASFSDTLKGVTGFGVVTTIEETFFDGFNTTARVTASLPTKFQAADSLIGYFDMLGGVEVYFNPVDRLASSVSAIIDPAVSETFVWDLNASIWVGKDMLLDGNVAYAREGLVSSGYASKDITHAQVVSDILNSYVSTVILYSTTTFIAAEVPPNGTLEIDSDTYTVLLNGVSILHLHEGDWLFLDRSVVGITVDSGTGGALDGKVLYKERYL